MKRSVIILILFVALVALGVALAPWKSWTELGLERVLTAKGYPGAQLTLESLTLNRMVLRDVAFGKDVPIVFDTLTFDYTPDSLQASKATLAEAHARWGGGTLSARDAALSWAGDERLKANIEIDRVPLSGLMQMLTGGRADATGNVSGRLPLTVYADGTFSVQGSRLAATDAGTLTLAPDAIPGDNEQVGLVRDVLKNFHYRQLVMTMDSEKDKKLSMLLSLSGNNPDVYNGREIKLNVRLTGDLISLLQQSVFPMTDPKQLLKQD